MMPPVISLAFAGFCDRCSRPYLAGQFPNHALCAGCYVATAKALQSARGLAR